MARVVLRQIAVLLLAFSMLPIGTASAEPPALKFVAEPLPPFSYEQSGKGAGPMAEVVQAVCASAELKCSITVLPWRRVLKLTEIGMVDGICVALRIPEREQMFFITDDVAQSSFTFFSRNGTHFKYRSPDDLSGATIGVYGPSGTSATLDELAKNTSALTELEVDNLTALKKLAAGRYGINGAILINRDVALSLIENNGIVGVGPAGDAKIINYALGLSRKTINSQQAELFNNKLRALKRAGTVKLILQKYGIAAAP